ncbi:DNA-directed RNA polymerase I subunit RPA34.5-domain-containing protein [Phaeosphaeria sp. MPI-PUGE-AT-0046c]|nr:DNA-directed RNA polymerase I subunit RPA34.5-domain-containing protein [Phaeosphaeria sp. MPI-PUGE-AT-0046c]
MKEAKKTKVPLPVHKAKANPRLHNTPSKAQLSQEYVSSDDDSLAEQDSSTKPARKPKTAIAVHRPDGALKLKEKLGSKTSATPKTKEKAKPTPKKATPKQVVTQAQADELSSSEQSDDNDNVRTRDMETNLAGNGGQAAARQSNSTSDSDSESSSDDTPMNDAPQPTQKPTRPAQSQPHVIDFRPTQAYIPPKGYNAVPYNDKTTSKAAQLFNNLQGKQIWHITAPAGLPLKDLSEMAMERAMDGEAVLNHKDTAYGFSKTANTDEGACRVMIPQKNGYTAVSANVARSLHLRATVKLPHLSTKQADQNTGSEAAASITRSTIRAPRPQLKGLKMRFLPIGFGTGDAGTLGDSDSEGETSAPAGLGMPMELNLPSRKEKRKHGASNGDAAPESPTKKHKKHRSSEEVQRKEERRAKKEKRRAQEAAAAKV